MKIILRFVTLVLIVSISWSQNVLVAKEPKRLAPTSKWHMRYEDDSCRLVRQFGEGKDKMMLVLVRFGPDDGFRMTLAGKPLGRPQANRILRLRFGDHETEQKIEYSAGKIEETPALIAHSQVRISPTEDSTYYSKRQWKRDQLKAPLPPIPFESYEAVKYLWVKYGHRNAMILETGSLGPPVNAINKCIDELMTHWGIDVARHKSIKRSAQPATYPGNWVKSSEYPTDMLRRRQPGLVNFRLSVDATGKPTACHIQQTTRPEEFDKAVCKALMKRAIFDPALDADGKPIASYWRNTVRFAIR